MSGKIGMPGMFLPPGTDSIDDFNAHAARGSRDHAHGTLDAGGVQIGHLGFGDFANLLPRNLRNLVFVGHAGTRSRWPQAFLIRTAAGGVLVIKVNERSAYTVITTGITSPTSFFVRSLNSFVKAMIFTPCWPRAGPTGGAGVALPAGICSLIYPVIF